MTNLTFKDLGLREGLLRAIDDLGFTSPSPIQAESLPVTLEGFDIIGQAQTGTGKTAAFGCAIINNIQNRNSIASIILAPTRELALQVHDELIKLTKYEKLNIVAVYGGAPIHHQARDLKRANIVVGTPGRVLDHIRRGNLPLDKVEVFVLDEADEMLNMGFIDDMEEIMKSIPEERQTLLFSATMPAQIKKLTKKYLKADAKHIAIAKTEMTASKIAQYFYEVQGDQRLEALCRLIDFDMPQSSIIFCRTKKGVDDLVTAMQSRGYMVEGMHGDMSQVQRMKTLKKFKDGALKFLVATDVAARGIDVEGVTHVINYELPQDIESYVHRIGRTGRAGREGTAYSIITPREFGYLRQIRNTTKSDIVKKSVPTVQEIYNNKFTTMVDEVSSIIDAKGYDKFVDVAKELNERYDAIEVIASLMKSQFDTKLSFDYSTDALVAPKSQDVRLFFSAGKRDGLTIKNLLTYITDNAKVGASQIRNIDIMENFTFVNVDEAIHQQVLTKCTGNKINKRKINVEVATGSKGKSGKSGGRSRGFNRDRKNK
ncbi:DEAD-box ATP-dependent RNA helicase CshA [uncultured Clostridium sp.]|uniref:DEAD/DEAH box helicase n=1 Tax=uncultured Clostridium sp. TaxID=59620 RepID=UPI00082034C5|nr:DEAD/DEAH box helicase [uncultured Clostridium sp.]SCK02089.1 DEAD-box ATP-dependent RNA helicase CshA [uncultured Clostridium sp.]